MFNFILWALVVIVSIICIFVMKKIQPENFKLYLAYVILIDVALGLLIYAHNLQ